MTYVFSFMTVDGKKKFVETIDNGKAKVVNDKTKKVEIISSTRIDKDEREMLVN